MLQKRHFITNTTHAATNMSLTFFWVIQFSQETLGLLFCETLSAATRLQSKQLERNNLQGMKNTSFW
uniref:Uncharacterized protein n=1 Tax=Ixodes ricinus TaxID=34613 RepID=A0A0K8R814_IXORI